MKHLFIINPAAGKKGSTDALVAQIHLLFAGQENYEIAITSGVGDAQRLTAAAAASGEDLRIYACGGDGTLNEAVNGAAGLAHVAITNVPKGTGNDFLKIFGPNCRARFLDLAALRDGPQTALDLMDCNGKLGIGCICAGVDARVAADVHKYKRLPLVTGMGAYILALLANVLFKGISRPMQVEMGPTRLNGEVSIICVCNGRYYGGGFMPVGEAQPDDGVLDMLLVGKISLPIFFRLVGKYAKGKYKECAGLITDYHGQSMSFTVDDGDGVAVVDGEVMRGAAFTIRRSELKINFFYPADVFWREGEEAGTLAAAL
ncbi:MAG: diacylglycerol kinase family protein [Pseudoflavonifractor sp.]